jgi:hypothetical protein
MKLRVVTQEPCFRIPGGIHAAVKAVCEEALHRTLRVHFLNKEERAHNTRGVEDDSDRGRPKANPTLAHSNISFGECDRE